VFSKVRDVRTQDQALLGGEADILQSGSASEVSQLRSGQRATYALLHSLIHTAPTSQRAVRLITGRYTHGRSDSAGILVEIPRSNQKTESVRQSYRTRVTLCSAHHDQHEVRDTDGMLLHKNKVQ
jgi:hypothetical protein